MSWLEREIDLDKKDLLSAIARNVNTIFYFIVITIFIVFLTKMLVRFDSTWFPNDWTYLFFVCIICGMLLVLLMGLIMLSKLIQIEDTAYELRTILYRDVLKKKTIMTGLKHGEFRYLFKTKKEEKK